MLMNTILLCLLHLLEKASIIDIAVILYHTFSKFVLSYRHAGFFSAKILKCVTVLYSEEGCIFGERIFGMI